MKARAKKAASGKITAPPAKKTVTISAARRSQISVAIPPEARRSTAAALLKHAGKWTGDDLDKVIDIVTQTRSKTRF